MKAKLSDYSFMLLLAVVTIVPFAIPYAYFPLSKFYSESLAWVVALLIFATGAFSRQEIKIPPSALACFAFAVFALVQPFVVHLYFPGNNTYLALIFILSGFAAIGVSTMVGGNTESFKKIMIFLSWSLVIAVTIQSIIAYLQYTGKASAYSDYLLVSPDGVGDGSGVFGNIGQPNQFTDFISIGMVALMYLFVIGQINILVFVAYGILFALAITFTARRGVLVYYMLMAVFAIWMWLRNRKNEDKSSDFKKIMFVVIAVLVGIFAVEILFPKLVSIFSTTNTSTLTGVERLSTSQIGQSTFRRFYEWYKAIVLFTEHPFFGVGWYQYPREGIYIMQTEQFSYIPMNQKLYTHCHNSLLNIMAETGILGTIILVGYGIGYSIFALLRKLNSTESLFAVLLCIPILTHSLLEYPLWYGYFMVLLVIFLSFAPAVFSLPNKAFYKGVAGLVVAIYAVIFYNANQVNNQLMSYTQTPASYDDFADNMQGMRQLVDSNSMWALPTMMVMDNYIMPGSQATNAVLQPAEQLKYIDQLASALPYPGALFKQIILHKMLGDNAGANKYANILAHAYPYYAPQFIQQLSSNPEFADVVKTLQSFHYEDKSQLSKIFDKNKSI